MLRRTFLGLSAFMTACAVAPRFNTSAQDDDMTDDEKHYWMTHAALLDPGAYHVVQARSQWETIDVTVPTDEAWHVVNAFSVYYNTPVAYVQDPYPMTRRAGFLRPLDARRAMMLPGGTRIRNVPGDNPPLVSLGPSYLYYCAPQTVWDTDERYDNDPRGLYFQRLRALESLELRELLIEANGGGSIDDVLRVAIPSCVTQGMLLGASIYDGCWALLGGYNLMSEINNSHAVRFAESLMCPFRRGALVQDADGTEQAYFEMRKGSNADAPGSTDPAIAYPIKGTANVQFVSLPSDW